MAATLHVASGCVGVLWACARPAIVPINPSTSVKHRARLSRVAEAFMSGEWRCFRHVTLAAPCALRVRRADLDARGGAGMAGGALFAQLQCVRNRRRRPWRGAVPAPRPLWKAGEARGDEQRLSKSWHVTLATPSHGTGGGLVTVRGGGCDPHTIDDGAVAVVAGDAGADGRIVWNRRRRAIVGPFVRTLAGRARDGRCGRVSSAGGGSTECDYAEERR
jgi:hypothetical protein